MFAVGHLALGYLTGKPTSKLLAVDINIPLLFFASIIPDIDLLVPSLHRGPTHSLVVYALFSVPFFMLFGKKTIIYFVALAQHAMLGDLLATGGMTGVQLLWPLTQTWYTTPFYITALTNVYMEWTFFLISIMVMLKTKDLQKLFQSHPLNVLLTIPVFTIILPVFFGYPVEAPVELLIPHLAYLILLGISISIDFKAILIKKMP